MQHPADHEGSPPAADPAKPSSLAPQPLDADPVYARMNGHEVGAHPGLLFGGPEEVILGHIHPCSIPSYGLDESLIERDAAHAERCGLYHPPSDLPEVSSRGQLHNSVRTARLGHAGFSHLHLHIHDIAAGSYGGVDLGS